MFSGNGAMAERSTDLDDMRYAHHVKHRGQTNHRIFWFFWFLVSAVILARFMGRTYIWFSRRSHRRHRYARLHTQMRPGYLKRFSALCNVMSTSPWPNAFSARLPALSLGHIAAVSSYLAIIFILLTSVDAPPFSAHYADDIAFRAAWVTLSHIPLIYLLSTKRGPINFLAGLSYERVNWFHRWLGRGLFICATVHMAVMKSSISIQDILHSRDEGMTVVRFGIAAYTTLAWIAGSSMLPLRRWSHRAFYLNHWLSTAAFLFILLQHVPRHAQIAVHIACSILVFDKFFVAYYFCIQNLNVRNYEQNVVPGRRPSDPPTLVLGYPIKMSTPSKTASSLPAQTQEVATVVRINNVPFTWKPGQHVRMYVPALGRFEMHPFTPANCSVMQPPPLPPRKDVERGRRHFVAHKQPLPTSEMLFMIKEKSGITQRLAQYYKEWLELPCPNASQPTQKLTAYIDGPYGEVPDWEQYENLVLIASSTGVSFTLAILDYLEQLCFSGSSELKTKSVTFIWTMRHTDPHFEEVVKELLTRYSEMLVETDIDIQAEFYTTCKDSKLEAEMTQYDPFAHLRHNSHQPLSSRPPLTIRHPDEIYEEWEREAAEMIPTDDASPFVPSTAESYEWDEYADDNSDETCTLVEQGEEQDDSKDPFSDAHATNEHDDAYRPLSAPLRPRSQTVSSASTDREAGCQCALVQHQRRKLHPRCDRATLIVQNHGMRPNMRRIVDEAMAPRRARSTMVAVCANPRITRDVKSVVASAKLAFARGLKDGIVDLHAEEGL